MIRQRWAASWPPSAVFTSKCFGVSQRPGRLYSDGKILEILRYVLWGTNESKAGDVASQDAPEGGWQKIEMLNVLRSLLFC